MFILSDELSTMFTIPVKFAFTGELNAVRSVEGLFRSHRNVEVPIDICLPTNQSMLLSFSFHVFVEFPPTESSLPWRCFYNAHDMIIRSDKRSHGRISGKNFEWWGFEITELRSSNGKTTGNRFDFEIAGLLRLNLVRNIEGPLCSEIPCLVAPRVARCLGT